MGGTPWGGYAWGFIINFGVIIDVENVVTKFMSND